MCCIRNTPSGDHGCQRPRPGVGGGGLRRIGTVEGTVHTVDIGPEPAPGVVVQAFVAAAGGVVQAYPAGAPVPADR
jgi:hypothetical protein